VARRTFSAVAWSAALAGAVTTTLVAAGTIGVGDATAGALLVLTAAVLTAGLAHRIGWQGPAAAALVTTLLCLARWGSTHGFDARFTEILLTAPFTVMIVVLVATTSRRLADRAASVIADGLIVGLGAWIIVWVLLVEPASDPTDGTWFVYGALDSVGDAVSVLRAVVLAAATVVVMLLAILLFSGASNTAIGFGAAAVLGCVAAAIVRAVSLRDDVSLDPRWFDALLLGAALAGAAALFHPSVRTITAGRRVRISSPLMARLTATTAALIAPVIVLAGTDAPSAGDRIVRIASSVVLAVAVMTRVVQSVRANASTQDELVRSALTDSLTGLPNRTLMLRHIDTALRSSWGTPRQPTVLFIDVDRFKAINDSLGHATGDDVLTTVASRLLASVPDHAVVGRISGDEFVVLDDRTETAAQSVMLAEKLLDAFREPVGGSQPDMFVTASIGVAHAPSGMDLSADALMRHADTAMYRAKDAGRNCIAVFDDSMVERVTQRLDIETALYRALERGEVHLVHQPIVDVDLGLVVGFEALMRWRREGAPVSPADFIPVAEDTGTIVPLGTWALRDALARLRGWIDDGTCKPSTTMSVNVSPRQLNDPQFVHTVVDALAATRVSADQLWLEVTEGVMITEPDQALATLRRLESLGVRIAVDDFGTGYSSLSLLQRFPIHCVKIDRTFVQRLDDPGTRTIVRTIVAMAGSLSAEVVAEGVETAGQLSLLASLGCSRVQGYLIGAPVGVADVPAVVADLEDRESFAARINPARA